MKDTQSIGSQNEIGVIAPMKSGEFKWVYSEVKNTHAPKIVRFSGKIKDFNNQIWCLVCGRDAQIGSDFCSMKCQSNQTGV